MSRTAWRSPSSIPNSSGSSTPCSRRCAATVGGRPVTPTGSPPRSPPRRQPVTRTETMAMTREQATAAVAVATEQRDGIQANLLDLDSSFGKRLLAGANLAGQTKQRWEAATADLASMWEIFTAYSAVVDRAAELLARIRRSSGTELAEITTLLTGISVRLTRAPAPLARRELTDSGRSELTLATAVREMNRTFARVAEVVTTAETVWNEVADRLDRISADLGQAGQRAEGLADDESAGALASASAELGRLRDVLNSDPLALWQRDQVDTTRLERLREQTAVAVSRVGELARLRDDAQRRIGAVTAAAATQRCQDAERAAAALLARRDELRGLLDAYQAKAARLGAAEDQDLTARYDLARDLLWTAPCDLSSAAGAVTRYQEAIVALSARGRQR